MAKKNSPSAATVSAPVAADNTAVTASLFVLTAKAPRQALTPQLQGVKSGLGKGWVAAAKPVHNSRATALATLAALGSSFTQAAALAALGALPKGTLGSGTPRSYWAAFVASGYIAPQA